MSTTDPFAQDVVPILDSRKSLADYIHHFYFESCTSLVYSNNDIKAAQPGGGFSVLQLISLTIFHKTIFLAGDTRQEIDVTIADAEFVRATSLNALSMLVSNSKKKEEIFRSNFPMSGA